MKVPELLKVPVPSKIEPLFVADILNVPLLLKIAPLPIIKSLPPEPLKVSVPALFQVRMFKFTAPVEAVMLPPVTPEVVEKDPLPWIVPADHVISLVTDTAPFAVRVPPLRVKVPMLVVPLKVLVPLLIATVVRPVPVMVPDALNVTVLLRVKSVAVMSRLPAVAVAVIEPRESRSVMLILPVLAVMDWLTEPVLDISTVRSVLSVDIVNVWLVIFVTV